MKPCTRSIRRTVLLLLVDPTICEQIIKLRYGRAASLAWKRQAGSPSCLSSAGRPHIDDRDTEISADIADCLGILLRLFGGSSTIKTLHLIHKPLSGLIDWGRRNENDSRAVDVDTWMLDNLDQVLPELWERNMLVLLRGAIACIVCAEEDGLGVSDVQSFMLRKD
jgi:hypothetical protein